MATETDPRPIAELTPAIRAVSEWLSDFPARGAVIGGIAVGLLGVARMTRDVDAVVWIEYGQLDEFVSAAARFGIVPRIAELLSFAAESRVLLLQHRPTGVEIDVSLAALPFEDELLDRAVEWKVANFLIRLATVEDLIVMKTIANRSRDWTDIDALIELHPRLDVERVLYWSNAFAEALESPEIIGRLTPMLAKRGCTSQSGGVAARRVSTAVGERAVTPRAARPKPAKQPVTKAASRSKPATKSAGKPARTKKKTPISKPPLPAKKKANP